MAKRVQKIKGYTEYLPINEKVQKWGEETISLIRKNFKTQKIFPEGEIYAGWFAENEKRAGKNSWHSTGAGFDSLYFELIKAAEDDIFHFRVLEAIFRYHQYLDYVDLGVGKNRPAEKVQRGRPAEHDKQYFKSFLSVCVLPFPFFDSAYDAKAFNFDEVQCILLLLLLPFVFGEGNGTPLQ